MASVSISEILRLDCINIILDLPDLLDANNVVFLDRWEGAWSYLSTLKWVRVSSAGQIQPAIFPPKGQS
jgi:translation machinery-associated protein 16